MRLIDSVHSDSVSIEIRSRTTKKTSKELKKCKINSSFFIGFRSAWWELCERTAVYWTHKLLINDSHKFLTKTLLHVS